MRHKGKELYAYCILMYEKKKKRKVNTSSRRANTKPVQLKLTHGYLAQYFCFLKVKAIYDTKLNSVHIRLQKTNFNLFFKSCLKVKLYCRNLFFFDFCVMN